MSTSEQRSVWHHLRKMDRSSILRETRDATILIAIFTACLYVLAYAALAMFNILTLWVHVLTFLLAAAAGVVLGVWRNMKTLLESGILYPEDPARRLKRRVTAINTSLVEAAKLMDELRQDLEAQQAARDVVLAEAQRQQELLELSKEDAEKIRKILLGESEANKRAERRRNLTYVGIGAMLSIPVGVFVNWIS